MLSNGTVKLLNDLEIGFDAKYLKLEPTNLKEPPKVLSKEISEEEIKTITPYIDRYAIHRDINKNKIPTRNIGYAKISRDNLTKTESLDKILLKIKELKDKIDMSDVLGNSVEDASTESGQADFIRQEASEALVALGYTVSDAYRVLQSIPIDENTSVENVIKQALRKMV